MRNEVRRLLLVRLQQSLGADILAKQAKERIESRGADVGGYAELWANRAKPLKVKTGKNKYRLIEHYRKGGTPLRDTGNLFNQLKGRIQGIADGVRMHLSAPLYAVFHQHGFRTTGPNFIPFTRGAARRDAKAINRREFVVARRGVTVPARPIFAMPLAARKEVARTIARALGAR